MAIRPERTRKPQACRLRPFAREWAERVVSWIRDEREAYWLAPKSRPPITARELLRWHTSGHEPFMLLVDDDEAPAAYGELNHLVGASRQYWLGHLIVDPEQRGRGLGVELTRRLLAEGFEQRGARRISLVVFPDNEAAIDCYRAAGMLEDGYEWHSFPAHGRRECLIRFATTHIT